MKLIFVALLSLLFLLPLPAGILSSDGISFKLKKDSLSLDFSRYGVKMESPLFSLGAMDGSGLLASLDKMHETLQTEPSFSSVGKTSKTYGGSFRYGSFGAFAFIGKREGIGISGKQGELSGAVLYAGGAEESPHQKDLILRRDCQTLYVLGEYEGKYLRLAPAFSVTETLLFSSFLSMEFSLHNMFISLSNGKLQSFLKDGDDYRQSVSFGYEGSFVSFAFLMHLGRTPIYSYEYRTYEADWKIAAEFGLLKLEDHVDKRFSKGKETRKETLSLSWEDCTFSFDTENGVSLSFLLGATRIVLRKDSFSVETEFSKGEGALEWKLKLSSEKVFDVKITLRI